ncbi:MAG: methyltransferase domain-containing protein [Planctomycetes bacterium]|nr:methyltransferase domain-containing protein [Planctomycetota bacterium]
MSDPRPTDPRLLVTHEHDGRLCVWRLAAPPGNVIDRALVAALRTALRSTLAAEPHALLLCSSGPHWSYGASIPDHRHEAIGPFLVEFHAFVREFLASSIPTVAALRGRCFGGGLELALLAQRLVAARDVTIGTPEVDLGVFAPVASLLLPARVGQPFADRMLTTGRAVAADESLARGLVDELADDPEAAARDWIAREWLSKSRTALRFAARAARFDLADRVEALLARIERLYRGDLMATADANEGVAAFLAKRPPSWRADGSAAQPDWWQERWAAGRTGWHRERPQPWLVAERERLFAGEAAPRVLVPLCGKSVDLPWLAAEGARVVGIDVAERARIELMQENGLELAARPDATPPFTVHFGDRLEFWCGDLFALDPVRHGQFDAIFDRAALIALPRVRRSDYARTLIRALREGGRLLLVGIEFDGPSELGPPFHVPRKEAAALFRELGEPLLVGDRELVEEAEFWAEKGVRGAREYALFFRRVSVAPVALPPAAAPSA